MARKIKPGSVQKPIDYSKLSSNIEGSNSLKESIRVQEDTPTIEQYRRIYGSVVKDLADANTYLDLNIPPNFLITRILLRVYPSTNTDVDGAVILSWIGKNTLQFFNITKVKFTALEYWENYVNFMDTAQLFTLSGGKFRFLAFGNLANLNSTVSLTVWGFQY